MVIYNGRIVFLLYSILLAVMVYYKININYFTPDENFYLFSESMLSDPTVATRYKFIAYLFRLIYQYGGFIALTAMNLMLVRYLISCYNKNFYNESILRYVILCFLFPSVIFYAASFLRDFYIYALVVLFITKRYGVGQIKTAWLIIIIIGFLKIELAAIITLAMIISRVKINPLIFIFILPLFGICWYFMLNDAFIIDLYIRTLVRFEPTVFAEYNHIFFGLQQMEPTPLNGTLNLAASYVNLFFPFLISWPTNTGNAFNVLMSLDSLLFFLCIIFSMTGFNRIRYINNELYRVSVLVILLSIIYGYFMVTPMTSLRMHTHFIPFIMIFLTGSRFKVWKKRY